jgi:N-methylhydantoinase A
VTTRIGIDIGGTFTDLVLVNEATGQVSNAKALSTPQDLTEGVIDCLRKAGADLREARIVVHGTTVGINAVLEHKAVRTALLTTEGFRDVLEIGRGDFLRMYDVLYQRPAQLVPRSLRFEIPERLSAGGKVLRELDDSHLSDIVEKLRDAHIQSVAVVFLFSWVNPTHEQRTAAALAELLPGVAISVSHRITQEWREYERTSTTVINAMIQPIMDRYLGNLETALAARGFNGRILITQSNGGVFSLRAARIKPVHAMESGPAAGVVGCAAFCREIGESRLIAFDMGGTTAKCCAVDDGQPAIAEEYGVEGYPIRIPVLDIREVSAGGGSIAWIDAGGALCLGPQSAGAEPGPVCYGRGGTQPTVTDANLVLGRINARSFLGGRMPLDRDSAIRTITQLADRLGLDPIETAAGILRLADVRMALSVRSLMTARGFDPRDYALVAYGGCGPLHAASIARELSISRLLIPPGPSTFSAWGMLAADLRHDLIRTVVRPLDRTDSQWADARFAEMAAELKTALSESSGRLLRSVDLRYLGQEHTVSVPLSDLSKWEGLREQFDLAHQRVYGYAAKEVEVELLNLRLSAISEMERPRLETISERTDSTLVMAEREIYSMNRRCMLATKVVRREELRSGDVIAGPAAIEEPSTTTIIEPQDELRVDDYGCLRIRIDAAL